MDRPEKGFALITGASKGLGNAMAVELAILGHNLLLVARNEPELKASAVKLKQKYDIEVFILPIDLAENGASAKLVQWVEVNNYNISILINNAGYGLWGNFKQLPLSDQLNMMQLNMNTLVENCYLLLPHLSRHKQAYILNISSTAAYQAVPTLAIYSATKSFVLSFTRAIRYELKDSPVSVTCFSPGPIETGFAQRAGMDAFSKMAEKFNMQPAEVAKIALKAMFNKQSEVVPGLSNLISVYANRILPKGFIEKMAASIYKT